MCPTYPPIARTCWTPADFVSVDGFAGIGSARISRQRELSPLQTIYRHRSGNCYGPGRRAQRKKSKKSAIVQLKFIPSLDNSTLGVLLYSIEIVPRHFVEVRVWFQSASLPGRTHFFHCYYSAGLHRSQSFCQQMCERFFGHFADKSKQRNRHLQRISPLYCLQYTPKQYFCQALKIPEKSLTFVLLSE